MRVSEPRRFRLLLVDDHVLVRQGIRLLLERDPRLHVVGDTGSVAAALEVVRRSAPDLIIAEERLPDHSGVDLCRQIRAIAPATRILFLSTSDDAAVPAILAGASGFILKSTSLADLVQAIRVVVDGGAYVDPKVAPGLLRRLWSPVGTSSHRATHHPVPDASRGRIG